ncbi:hypothetical protein BP00DRAFT_463657 [Aspergillus indologenus CBS 114.80]|uniref:HTH araC/xylS-type domain-containing protein n=1 Tax=Aspergillus indologenus CBS 114.80 TaxID=1450541 RepID=A0A2V5HZF6_9EURO|nr:hypothetical protein BP00DRAFT_463657 [Aspergillus indologenus CBS 114.80]
MTPTRPATHPTIDRLNNNNDDDPPSSQNSSSTSASASTPQARWRALTHRAPSSHHAFIYGVKSTKIYCRPTCAARRARRANVEFFDTAAQARAAGFRPCKRCRPDCAGFVGEREALVARVIALLRREPRGQRGGGQLSSSSSTSTSISTSTTTSSSSSSSRDAGGGPEMKLRLKDLAREAGVTPSYLCRVFKRTMGVTIGEYVAEFEREGCDAEGGGEGEVAEGEAGVGVGGGLEQMNAGVEHAMPVMILPLGEVGGGAGGAGGTTLSTPAECSWNVFTEGNLHGVDPALPSFDLEEWVSSEAFLDSNLLSDDGIFAVGPS